jgi:hypothetical protein
MSGLVDVVVRVSGADRDAEPLGAVRTSLTDPLSVLRECITRELEVLRNFRFVRVLSPLGGAGASLPVEVKVNLPQERLLSVRELYPNVSIRYYAGPPGSFIGQAEADRTVFPAASDGDEDVAAVAAAGGDVSALARPIRDLSDCESESEESACSGEAEDSDVEQETGDAGKVEDEVDESVPRVLVGEPVDTAGLLALPFNANWFEVWDRHAGDARHTLPLYKLAFAIFELLSLPLDANSPAFLCLGAIISNIGPSFETVAADQAVPSRDVFVRLLQTFGPMNGLLDRSGFYKWSLFVVPHAACVDPFCMQSKNQFRSRASMARSKWRSPSGWFALRQEATWSDCRTGTGARSRSLSA